MFLDSSLPIFKLLERRPFVINGCVDLIVTTFVTRVKRTTDYVPQYYDDCAERNDIITTVNWTTDVTVAKLYLIQYDAACESLTVGLHFIELDTDRHIQKLESHTIWPKRDTKPVAKLDRSMPIFEMLEQMERPYRGEVRLHVNTFKRKRFVDKKYSIKYDEGEDWMVVSLNIYDHGWEQCDAEHYYEQEYVTTVYEKYVW